MRKYKSHRFIYSTTNFGRNPEEKRPLGRHRRRLGGGGVGGGLISIIKKQDERVCMQQWWALVNTVMKLFVP
jgi:hypothetical protein